MADQSISQAAKLRNPRIRRVTNGATIGASGYSDFPQSYKSWLTMRRRCTDVKDKSYPNYGARGIKVHPEWMNDYNSFHEYMGDCPDAHTLDRIEVNGNYEPGNVRWATAITQARNTRTTPRVILDGVEMSVRDACLRCGINPGSVRTLACRRRLSVADVFWQFFNGESRSYRPRARASEGGSL